MTPLDYLLNFRGELEQIGLHIAREDMATAGQLVDDLYERCLMLQAHPRAGLSRTDIAPDRRQLVVGGYIVSDRRESSWYAYYMVGVRSLPGTLTPDWAPKRCA